MCDGHTLMGVEGLGSDADVVIRRLLKLLSFVIVEGLMIGKDKDWMLRCLHVG